MADPRQELQHLFSLRNRYSNFGPALAGILIRGFRGIDELALTIESPITAISGLNGTGKSTVAQLSTAAYKKPVTESEKYKRHIIANYFPVSRADPKPFRDDASIEYKYFTASPERLQELTVTRRRGSQWEGYKRQPERHCRYIGFTIYIPKVEQRDISIYRGQEISITNESELSESARRAISRILNHPYENLSSATAAHAMRSAEIGFATKFGAKYSENNMGFGEGRVFYTVNSLETAPEQSLFVIEEPETSLHEHAQHELAKYLIDVCLRRKHQIILTTHSRAILNALPRQSRKLLYRDGTKVCVSDRTSSAEATSQLTLGYTRAKTVLVEDARAKVLLAEVIRATKPVLLRGITITFVGNDDVVASLTKRFREDGHAVVGVRDADRGENTRQSLFKLPGTAPPEREVFGSPATIAHLQSRYGLNWNEWSALHSDIEFHDWPTAVAAELSKTEDGLWEELCAIYAAGCPEIERSNLINQIEA